MLSSVKSGKMSTYKSFETCREYQLG